MHLNEADAMVCTFVVNGIENVTVRFMLTIKLTLAHPRCCKIRATKRDFCCFIGVIEGFIYALLSSWFVDVLDGCPAAE